MAASDIVIKGAREHNLRSVSVTLPRNELICLTGVSGSGKSSLAFDTLYAEGQRRYVESLSTFARQFLGQMPKPDVDSIDGISPSISISQKTTGGNPRSTVGTITEIADYLRVLFARVGRGHCPGCGQPITAQSREQILQRILVLPEGTRFAILVPLIRGQKGEYRDLFDDLLKQGFVRARVDGRIVHLNDQLHLDRQMRHNIDVVVDRLTASPKMRARLAEAVDLALKMGEGNLVVAVEDAGPKPASSPPRDLPEDEADASDLAASDSAPTTDIQLSSQYACVPCGKSFEPPSPQLFSFNSPQGMCLVCHGLGEIYTFDPARLIPDPSRSFQQGCIETLGKWKDLGRWKRHIFAGLAETLERHWNLPAGSILETAWEELEPRVRDAILYGTGEMHVTYTWRNGPSGHKWGGPFEGIIPKLTEQYRTSRSKLQRQSLEKYMRVIACKACGGRRLNRQASAVTLTSRSPRFAERPERTLPEVCELAITEVEEFLSDLELDPTAEKIAAEAIKEIRGRLGFLRNVGLDYLTLGRTAPTLSGGEMQRIRLAGQIGCGLVGVLYVLDEPSIGLHPRDNDRLLETLARLRDQGNTVVVVEHDEDTMRAADHIVDFGPGPGVRGGRVVASGSYEEIVAEKKSLTGQYLSGARKIAIPAERRPGNGQRLVVRGARHNNLKGIDVAIPLGCFVCITGVSGSGKSSLVNDILVEALRRDLNGGDGAPGDFDRFDGLEHLDKMIAIDQSPIGRTPRSNPATYIKVLDDIRDLYCQLPEAKTRGYKPGRFSFNVAGGRCEACEGNGATKLEMDFLADIWVTCPVCQGHRFNRETLQVRFKGKSMADVLEMDVQEALAHFQNVPHVRHKLQTLHDVGLDYVKLGQPSPTLSGGEAQRIKLARELVKRATGRTLYLLDEPTTGLHFADIELLLKVLHSFVDAGNTVLVVEHNLEVVKTADWIVDLGPEGGHAGGWIVAQGTPEAVAAVEESHTGRTLRPVLFGRPAAPSRPKPVRAARSRKGLEWIRVRGAAQHNLKGVDADIPRDQFTVCCGPSGSGKSSLAMDTIYAEGQRRYVESLSAYARQFVGQMQKPKLEHIEGLSPAIAIEQKHLGHTPRSTVGTVTEIYDYLRILMARLGQPYCPTCDVPIGTQSTDEIVGKIMVHPAGTKLYLMAPVEIQVGDRYETLWETIREAGYRRVRIDGQTFPIDEVPEIDRRRKHEVEVVVDRLVVREDARGRVADSVEAALDLGKGVVHLAYPDDALPEPRWNTTVHSQHFACDICGRSFEPLSPHHFSFNSSLGWCPDCQGLGVQTGTNPTALLRSPTMTLSEGAVALWPDGRQPLFRAMLQAFSRQTGVPLDIPFDQMGARHRRLIFHGTGDQWFEAPLTRAADGEAGGETASGKPAPAGGHGGKGPVLRFQFKGLYPALDEASKLSPSLRTRLEHLVDEVECSACGGSRLRDDAAAVRLRGQSLDELCRMPLSRLLRRFQEWELDATEQKIAGEVVREIRNRLQFLVDVGLDYLTLGRPAPSLSGGEAQRIRLAAQVGSGLCGVLYVLDEPTIGLHPRDNRRLLDALKKLRDLGNTLLVVEHDREVLGDADQLLDFGPRAGKFGGQVVARGTPAQVGRQKDSVTGPYLSGKKAIPIPANRRMPSRPDSPVPGKRPAKKTARKKTAGIARVTAPDARLLLPPGGGWLEVVGARQNNLKNITARIPLGTFSVITGTSGSGKSSLVEDVLYNALARALHRAKTAPGAHDAILGVEQINKVIRVDQQPLGQTPTSTPATFTGAFDLIRELYSQLPESKLRGYSARRFSFNVAGGRCEKCEGAGQLCIAMHFLPDVWVECDSCKGQRYNPETLAVRFRGKSIADVLDMACGEAVVLFEKIPRIRRILQTLCDVGLDYLTLGQSAPTLSGGEAQRVKLAAELSRPDTGRTLYLLDEPTTGLHFDDLAKLLDVIGRLVDLGNTVVVIEHNLDVIKTADWVIDLGPEAGDQGGRIVAAGTPEDIVAHARRWTAANSARTEAALSDSSPAPVPGTASDSSPRPLAGEGLSNSSPRPLAGEGPSNSSPRPLAGEGPSNSSPRPPAGEGPSNSSPRPPAGEGPGVRGRSASKTPPPAPKQSRKKAKSAKSSALPAAPAPVTGEGNEPILRSHTGEALEPVLLAGPFVERARFEPADLEVPQEGDLEIAELGRETRMPWEIDGRRWHTRERVNRTGGACRWDGRILSAVVDRIQDMGQFSDTDWNARSVVEIRSEKKSEGWFFHAITGEEWLLKMKFRTARGTFKRADLIEQLDLKPLNDMPELPLYGTEPRVRTKSLSGPWQEIELRVHGWAEIDRPAFWQFVDRAVAGFGKYTEKARENPENLMPWKVLGRKWHFTKKGFAASGSVAWDFALLEELIGLLEKTCPEGQFQWTNKQVVPIYVEEQKDPWAAVQTKKCEAIYLHLTAPKGRVTLGRIAGLGYLPEMDGARGDVDVVHLQFRNPADLRRGDLVQFLREHRQSVKR